MEGEGQEEGKTERGKDLRQPSGEFQSRSNQSILKEINPEYSMEGLMLKFQNTLAT